MVLYLRFVIYENNRDLYSLDSHKITMTLNIYKMYNKRLYIGEEIRKTVCCVRHYRAEICNTDVGDLGLRRTSWSPKKASSYVLHSNY